MADVAIFVSYRHDDDDSAYGRIKKISNDVQRLYRTKSGLEVGLFFDVQSIELGEDWRARIHAGLTGATIFRPLLQRRALKPGSKTTISGKRFDLFNVWMFYELCELEPGSSQWMKAIGIIAERMKDVLKVGGVAGPRTLNRRLTPQCPMGFPLRKMRRFQEGSKYSRKWRDGLPSFNECAVRIGELTAAFNSRVTAATPLMQRAASNRQKLAVANALAEELIPISDAFAAEAARFQGHLHVIDPGSRVDGKGASSRLDKPLQRTQGAILIISGSRGIFRDWLVEISQIRKLLARNSNGRGRHERWDRQLVGTRGRQWLTTLAPCAVGRQR